MSVTAGEVFSYLEAIAPLSLQEKYDNSGLIVGRADTKVKGILVCLDCTEEVLDEAKEKGCNIVISHHPPVFYGMKRFNGSNLTERLVMRAIQQDTLLYAIHTNLDNVLHHGVNEKIAQQMGLEIEGLLRPHDGSSGNTIGAGIIGSVPEAMSEMDFLALIKNKMNIRVIRHTTLLGKEVSKVAICGGSGSFLLEDAISAGAQVFITADYKYHGFFDADQKIMICDIGHYESEQYTVELIQSLISGKFTTFAAHCTRINTNPIHYFT